MVEKSIYNQKDKNVAQQATAITNSNRKTLRQRAIERQNTESQIKNNTTSKSKETVVSLKKELAKANSRMGKAGLALFVSASGYIGTLASNALAVHGIIGTVAPVAEVVWGGAAIVAGYATYHYFSKSNNLEEKIKNQAKQK